MNFNTREEGKVIEEFRVAGNEGYSAFWRKNTSPVETRELAKLLTGLRKVASFVGPNTGTIVWSGMKHVDGIALDPNMVIGTYPVSFSKTDIMVGITVRKALERCEWSDRLMKHVQTKIDLSPPYRYKFNLFFEMCEKVYLDCLSNRSVLGLYTETARNWEISDKAKSYLHPPTVAELLHIWWELATDRSGKGFQDEYINEKLTKKTLISTGGKVDLATYYSKPLMLLNSIVPRLNDECQRIWGVTERGTFRLTLYESIWDDFLELIKFWPVDRSDPFLGPQDKKFEEEQEAEKEKENAAVKGLVLQIETSVDKKKPDYTSEVLANVNDKDDVVEIVGNDIVMEARDMINKIVFFKLRQIMKLAAQKRTIYNRGLTSGRIDRRKLYRAPLNGRSFLLKKFNFELLSDMILIIDATGSMADPNKWNQAQAISQTLFSAIKEYNKNARMFAYNEVKDKCRLTEVYGSEKFYAVMPHGRTASGEAIIATALKIKSNQNKKSYIIHITDGASNWGCGVKNAITFCKKRKIKLLTIGIACTPSAKTSLKDEYGQFVQFINHIDELPRLFGEQLRESRM